MIEEIGVIFIPEKEEESHETLSLDKILEAPGCRKVKEETRKFHFIIYYSYLGDNIGLKLGPIYRIQEKDNTLSIEPLIKSTKQTTDLENLEKYVKGLFGRIKEDAIGCATIKCKSENDIIKELIKKTFKINLCELETKGEKESLKQEEVKEAKSDKIRNNKEDNLRDLKSECINLLKMFKQIILQGPPGTGKTFLAEKITEELTQKSKEICEQKAQEELSNMLEKAKDAFSNKALEILNKVQYLKELEDYKKEEKTVVEFIQNEWERLIQNCLKKRRRFIQFHPSYTYEDFVRGITIVLDKESKMIQFEPVNKVFAEICIEAEKNEKENFVLIIDEINRANLPTVLGELIYALEYRGKSIDTPYEVNGDKSLKVPENVFIIGTMNTADRSVGNIDYAIRRRFIFYSVLSDKNKINNPKGRRLYEDIIEKIFNEDSNCIASEFKDSLEDIQIGHTYFRTKNETDEEELAYKFIYQVIPLLKEYIKDGILLSEEVNNIFEEVFGEGKGLSTVTITDVLKKMREY